MAATINQRARPANLAAWPWLGWAFVALELAAVYRFGQLAGWWWLGALVVLAVELRGLRPGVAAGQWRKILWERMPGVLMGLSVVLIITLVPRMVTQIGVTAMYAAWLVWREREEAGSSTKLVHLLVVQAVTLEAIFLMAAIWQTPAWLTLVLVWLGAYLGVYSMLIRRGDRSAGVMAATWGVVAVEISWVLLLWLITYTIQGGYILVPQPALILTAMAYIFGSILSASRQGNLSRARLGEYLVIGLILVVIVALDSLLRSTT